MSESHMAVQLPSPAYLGSFDRDEGRSQAGPLPLKRGEIGFVDGVHGATNKDEEESAESTSSSLPPRHPADRDYQSPSRRSFSQTPQAASETTVDESASNSLTITKGLFGCKKVTSIGGLQLPTLLLFALQVFALGGTIALWIFIAKRAKPNLPSNAYQNSMGSGTLIVFIHVVFIVIVLGQLVFLERRIFRLRAERYQHVHGEILPRQRRSSSSTDSIISAAPWNRPPLPTYATVLVQSGVATGDVEDNLIAIPPPPAYGNVRGSTLLYSSIQSR